MTTFVEYVRFLLQPLIVLLHQIKILIICVVIVVLIYEPIGKGQILAIVVLSGMLISWHLWAAGACALIPLLSFLMNAKLKPSVIAYFLAAPLACVLLEAFGNEGHLPPILELARSTLFIYLISAVPFTVWYCLNARRLRQPA